MYILGIDPGTQQMGFAVLQKHNRQIALVEAGVLEFESKLLQDQMTKMESFIDELCGTYALDGAAIESIFYAHNPHTTIKLAQFRGAICLKVLQKLGGYSEYTPLQVKQAVTGNGKSKKEQVAFMVGRILGIKDPIKPYDISDAIAVAITHAQRL